ncbi:MAG: ATP-binding protein, partial [Myxococcota bacterium]
ALGAWGTGPPIETEPVSADGPDSERIGDLLVVRVPLETRAHAHGMLVAGFSVAELDRVYAAERRTGMLLAIGLWGVGMVIAWAYGVQLSRPIRALTEATRHVGARNLGADAANLLPMRIYRRDERMVLTQAFVTMGLRLAAQVSEMEEERRRARLAEDEAVRANRAKSQFLANMSHELRTPLNAILGYTEMLMETTDDPESRDDLGRVQRAALHLLALINDVLDLAKIEAERMQLAAETFSIDRLVDEVLVSVQPLIAERGNRLVHERDRSLGEMTNDPLRVRQCLFNLLSNAVKFTERGRVRFAARRDGSDVVFVVEDTGIGMAPDQLDKLFQPFSQVDPSFTRRHGGTGLGLALTRRLCHVMGGDVAVASALGRGSVFTIRLPSVGPTSGLVSTAPPAPGMFAP